MWSSLASDDWSRWNLLVYTRSSNRPAKPATVRKMSSRAASPAGSMNSPFTRLTNSYPVVPSVAQSAGNTSPSPRIFSTATYSARAGDESSIHLAALQHCQQRAGRSGAQGQLHLRVLPAQTRQWLRQPHGGG